MSRRLLSILAILLSISISLFIFSLIYQNELPKIVEEINNSAIGAILTAVVTVFLLQGQSAQEEKRDKSVKVFEKKQEVYHEFISKLKEIVEDGEITIERNKHSGAKDELKELLFQLSYVQMHSSPEITEQVFKRVSLLIQKMNQFSRAGVDKHRLLPEFYADFSQEIFEIVSLLKSDLYSAESHPIDRNSVKSLLEQCDFFIDGEKMDEYQTQICFWNQLQQNLKNYGYDFEPEDKTQDVNIYYSTKRGGYVTWEFPVFKLKNGQQIYFFSEVAGSDNFYYGFSRIVEGEEYSKKVDKCALKCLQQIEQFKDTDGSNENVFAWKYPDRYALNFRKFNSPDFEIFNHPQRRAIMMSELAAEMNGYIKRFIDIANEEGLAELD